MNISEIQNTVMNNIVSLIREQKADTFSANCYVRKGSYRTRQLFLLNCLLLNSCITPTVLYAFYDRFDTGPDRSVKEAGFKARTGDKWVRMRMALDRMTKEEDRKAFVLKESRVYKNLQTVYSITREGTAYISELNSFLELPNGYTVLDPEDYVKLFRTFQKKTNVEHGIDTTSVLALTAVNGRYNVISPIEKEVQKDESFLSAYDLRQDGSGGRSISPDLAFSYQSDNKYEDAAMMPLQPVILEVDLDNERIGSGTVPLGGKLLSHLSYSEKISLSPSGTLPCSIICVISENTAQAEKASRERNDGGALFSGTEKDFILFGRFQDTVRYASDFSGLMPSELEEMDVPEIIKAFTENGKRYIEESLSSARSNLYERLQRCLRVCSVFEKRRGKKFYLRDMPELKRLVNYERGADYDESLDIRLTGKARDKSARISEYLLEKDYRTEGWYTDGHSLAIVPLSRYPDYMRSLHPYAFGTRQVRAVLNYLGLPSRWERFYPVFPLLRNRSYAYRTVLRNCFEAGGTRVFFEDISADISALSRIRDYITMPSDLVRNCLLVIVIDDDETVSGGRKLAGTVYTRGLSNEDSDGGFSFSDCFARDYGKDETVPLNFRRTHDFMFIKRSEFLAADPAAMKPFVKIGNSVSVTRSPSGVTMDNLHYLEGKTYHGCSFAVTEFRSFSMKGEVKRR